jgi:hypothetical protein
VITFTLLSLHQHISVAPDWPTGIALGAGGLAGGYAGARMQSRLPDVLIRRLVGILVIAIGPITCHPALADPGEVAWVGVLCGRRLAAGGCCWASG